MSRFVAISPDQLATMKDKPEMVGGVFALDAGLPLKSPSDLQEHLRRQAPQLVADILERLLPAVRQQLGGDSSASARAASPTLVSTRSC
jgi:hypothetical protein